MAHRSDDPPQVASKHELRTTLRDVYEVAVRAESAANGARSRVDELASSVGWLRERRAAAEAHDTTHAGRVDDHEVRIRALERYAWSLPLSALGAVGSAVVAVLVSVGVIG